jgi:hypothetical protein
MKLRGQPQPPRHLWKLGLSDGGARYLLLLEISPQCGCHHGHSPHRSPADVLSGCWGWREAERIIIRESEQTHQALYFYFHTYFGVHTF